MSMLIQQKLEYRSRFYILEHYFHDKICFESGGTPHFIKSGPEPEVVIRSTRQDPHFHFLLLDSLDTVLRWEYEYRRK